MAGLVVALVGPDGAGKSTVSARLPEHLGRPTVRLYAGDNPEAATWALPTTRLLERRRRRRGVRPVPGPPPLAPPARRRPLGRRLRGAPRAVLLLVLRCAEERAALRRARRLASAGSVVVLDRCYLHDWYRHDVTGEGRSPLQRAHGWWLAHAVDRPDLTVVLDAPAEVLWARKPEGDLAAVERRRSEYTSMPPLTLGWCTVDASRPLDDVARAVAAAVESHRAR